MVKAIAINPEFSKFVPSQSPFELELLRASLKESGCREPVVVWKRGDERFIVDGHTRHRICTEEGIEYSVKEIDLGSDEEALMYMLVCQLGRRNLNPLHYSRLRGKYHNLVRQTRGGDRMGAKHQSDALLDDELSGKTSRKLADKWGISQATIERDARFARACDTIDSVCSEEASRKMIEAGAYKFDLTELADLSPENQRRVFTTFESKGMESARKEIRKASKPGTDELGSEDLDKLIRQVEQFGDRWPKERRADLAEALASLSYYFMTGERPKLA